MSRRSFHAVVHGIVQGVAFRYYTQRAAGELGVVGWVRNLPDGTVEVLAEGGEERLGRFAEWLRRGPSSARVEKLELDWREPEGRHDSFEITFFSA